MEYKYNGKLMSGDIVVAEVYNGEMRICNEKLVPLYIKRTNNIEGWLSSRAIDSHRTNSRLLKKALRIKTSEDAEVVLNVNAATITDNYWFKRFEENITYAEVKFEKNLFDNLALYGDPNSFSQLPSRTPELTNIGSYEKCWKVINNHWWMYKNGSDKEFFSELFICKLGKKLGFEMAEYEMDGDYIRSLNFTEKDNTNFEPIASLINDNDDYNDCFNLLYEISPNLAEQYLKIIYMDTLCYNMDRHTYNFGLLRSKNTGEILSLAPNYDNNIALISRGYLQDVHREKDGIIRFFKEFMENNQKAAEMFSRLDIPTLSRETIQSCLDEIPIKVDEQYIINFVLNGENILGHIKRFCEKSVEHDMEIE